MFSLFKKHPSRTDAISYCVNLAKEAEIEVVLEQGNYSGFLIFVDANNDDLVSHFKHQDAMSSFVETIENRISSGDFTDVGAAFSNIPGNISWKPKLDVVRGVFGKNKEPLFNWMGTSDE